MDINYFEKIVEKHSYIDPKLYDSLDIKRGLRNKNGTGVLVGITKVADVKGYEMKDGEKTPCEGELFYRGYSVSDLLNDSEDKQNFAFEEASYLLLFSELPSDVELELYKEVLNHNCFLPPHYLERVLLAPSSANLMNKLQICVLSLYGYDQDPDATDVKSLVNKSLELISKMPLLLAYSYAAKVHYLDKKSLHIHNPKKEYSTAENILHMIRASQEFTDLEAKVLDRIMVVHADHGGGNNSAFATHVVSSSGTDIYSSMAAAIGSLKGPRHGGANIKVSAMLEDIQKNVPNWEKKGLLKDYLGKILNKEVFDRSGLIYGLGHAVYTKSDPRALLLKSGAKKLAKETKMEEGLALIQAVEEIGGQILQEKRKTTYPIPANLDLYSGYIYKMLKIPEELYTPLFALSRSSGWAAHLIEQSMDDKLIRPAYVPLHQKRTHLPMKNRK